jgi:hypothetical protein
MSRQAKSLRELKLGRTDQNRGAVIVRLDRTIQYAAVSQFNFRRSGILDPRFRGDDGSYAR